jgi:hypothetical protein
VLAANERIASSAARAALRARRRCRRRRPAAMTAPPPRAATRFDVVGARFSVYTADEIKRAFTALALALHEALLGRHRARLGGLP